jgi:hypothetical protein
MQINIMFYMLMHISLADTKISPKNSPQITGQVKSDRVKMWVKSSKGFNSNPADNLMNQYEP